MTLLNYGWHNKKRIKQFMSVTISPRKPYDDRVHFMTEADLQLGLHRSSLVPLLITMTKRSMMQHWLDAIRHKITWDVSTEQPHFVVLPHVSVHRHHIVGEITAVRTKHELQICSIIEYNPPTTKGCCRVEGCQATHHSTLMIIFVGEWPVINVKEAMEEIIELKLLLVFTVSWPKLLTMTRTLHDVFKHSRKLTFWTVTDAGYAENALPHIFIVVPLQNHVQGHVIAVTFAPRCLRQLKM